MRKTQFMQCIVVTSLLLIFAPAYAGTYTDNSENGDMDEWTKTGNGGNWKVKNGELIIESLEMNTAIGLVMGADTWGDYTVGAKMKVKRMKHNPGFGVSTGLVLRNQALENGGYISGLGMSPQTGIKQAEIIVGKNFLWWHIEPGEFDWELDTWYDLRASIKGNQMKAYVDDSLVIEFEHDWYGTGSVGLSVTSLATAHFDDFFVTGDNIPDNIIRAVSMESKLATAWGKLKRYQ